MFPKNIYNQPISMQRFSIALVTWETPTKISVRCHFRSTRAVRIKSKPTDTNKCR